MQTHHAAREALLHDIQRSGRCTDRRVHPHLRAGV